MDENKKSMTDDQSEETESTLAPTPLAQVKAGSFGLKLKKGGILNTQKYLPTTGPGI